MSVYQNESNTVTAVAPLGDSASIAVSLPGETTSSSSGSGDLTLFDTESPDETAVENAGDGAFRALIRIESAAAPKDCPFDLVVPENSGLIPLKDGGAVLRGADGSMLGCFASPWARTPQERQFNRFPDREQPVAPAGKFSTNSAFPVAANLFWLPVLSIPAPGTRPAAPGPRRAAMQAAKHGVSQALIQQVIRNGIKSAGNQGTSVFAQGSGTSRIRVMVDNRTGNIITVTKG